MLHGFENECVFVCRTEKPAFSLNEELPSSTRFILVIVCNIMSSIAALHSYTLVLPHFTEESEWRYLATSSHLE